MNALGWIREHKTAWGRQMLAAFAVVWLNFALQPCVMALESDHEHECPHCPPAVMQHHEGHDMAAMKAPCDGSGDCGEPGEFNYDGRKLDFEFDSTVQLLFVLPGAPPDAINAVAGARDRAVRREIRAGASPPLHLLNCTFLN